VIFLVATGAVAQTTTVTTSGNATSGTVPLFNGSSDIENSVITQTNGNISFSYPSYGSFEESLWTNSPSGTGITTGNALCWVNHAITGGPNTAFSSATCTGSPDAYGDSEYDLYLSLGTTIGSEVWKKYMGVTTEYGVPSVLFPGSIAVSGNVGIGTSTSQASLNVNGAITISGSGAGLTFPDNSVQSTAYTGTCPSSGGDYAESVDVEGDKKSYEPGDVMVLASGSKFDVAKSTESYSTLVAGIYSTKPGYVGRRQTTDPKLSNKEIPMTMVGIVPTKVSAENGPIHRGDLLVTASRAGYAMKGTDRTRMMGAVVGKAMDSLNSGTGVIEVLVSLQ
jgi:hypothetical protein